MASDEGMVGLVESEAWERVLSEIVVPTLERLSGKLLNDEKLPEVERVAFIKAIKELKGVLRKVYEKAQLRPPRLLDL